MKVKIEGGGHCVEVEVGDDGATVSDLIKHVQTAWQETRVDQPRTTMGYAGQLTERTADLSVRGAGDYQRQVKPVTA